MLPGMRVVCCLGGVQLVTGLQTSCSKSFSEENRDPAMEQVSKAVWTTATAAVFQLLSVN